MKKYRFLLALILFSGIALHAEEDFVIFRLVRHGQPGMRGTVFTPEQKAAWIGLGLTPLGVKQAQLTGEFLKKEGRNYKVIASPQERASETADIICGILGTTFTLDKDLREVGNAIRETLPKLRGRFKHIDPKENMTLTEEQAKGFKESVKDMGLRGKGVIMKLVQSGEKGPFLLVSHGAFMNATIFTLTGKRAAPWNCGMTELKVFKDGKAQIVKAAFPEVLPADMITDNLSTFSNDPWHAKFLPCKAERPKDLSFLNREFEFLREKKNSSWKRSKSCRLSTKEGLVTLKGAASSKEAATLTSPRFPADLAGKYTVVIEAKGSGKGFIRVQGGGSHCKTAMELTPEKKEYTLEAAPHKTYKIHQIIFGVEPSGTLSISSFKILPQKASSGR